MNDTSEPVGSHPVARPRLRSTQLDAQLAREGYVVIEGAGLGVLAALRESHRRRVGAVPPGFHSTLYSSDREEKAAVHQAIADLLVPLVAGLFVNWRVLLCSFITKSRQCSHAMPPHQDWTFVDERTANSLNFWVPTSDVDSTNGAMMILPRSHLVPYTIRGTGTANPFWAVEREAAARMVTVRMRAGDVLVHDHRTLHGSPANQTDEDRIVAGCAILPEGIQALHFQQVSEHLLHRYAIKEDFFSDHTFGAPALPTSARYLDSLTFENPNLTVEDLDHAQATVP